MISLSHISMLPSAPVTTDGYKLGHGDQQPPKTEGFYFNLTPRSDAIARRAKTVLPDFDGKVVWAGGHHLVSWYLRDFWNETFFSVPREVAVSRQKEFADAYVGKDAVSNKCWGELHDLGYLPLIVKALPEGARVPMGVTPITWRESLPAFAWLPGYLESAISTEVWGTTTVSTVAFEYKRLFTHYAKLTGSDVGFVNFQSHDFSYRSLKGILDGAHRQIAHLFSSVGTDTCAAIEHVSKYYAPKDTNHQIGSTVAATQHSIASLNIQWELSKISATLDQNTKLLLAECAFLKRLITEVYPTGIVSYVADTYDHFGLLTEVLPALKDIILARVPNEQGLAKLVIRGDSGDPIKIICGDPEAELGSPEYKGSLQLLWEVFGGTVNEEGFKVLNPRVGFIYGDGMNLVRCQEVLEKMYHAGWASSNLIVGPGGYTYQFITRDNFGIAVKSTYAVVDGKGIELYKDPKTGDGTKKSARGLLRVEHENGTYVQYQSQTEAQEREGALKVIFLDSEVFTPYTTHIDEIRLKLEAEVYWNGPAQAVKKPLLKGIWL